MRIRPIDRNAMTEAKLNRNCGLNPSKIVAYLQNRERIPRRGLAARLEDSQGISGITVDSSNKIIVSEKEIEISAIRSQGAGGQNVNKVSSAIHLRFDIGASSIPDIYKTRLLKLSDQRITKDGVLVIKAQRHRSQEKNREEALRRLYNLIEKVTRLSPIRRPTKPTRNSQIKRLDSKVQRGLLKSLRKKTLTEPVP